MDTGLKISFKNSRLLAFLTKSTQTNKNEKSVMLLPAKLEPISEKL